MKVTLTSMDGIKHDIDLRCVVVKIGSAVITREMGRLDRSLINSYTRVISALYERGIRVVIVSSGAVSAGLGEVNASRPPQSIPEKQALAAIGQSHLMRQYTDAFSRYNRKVAQILLTRDDMDDRRRYLNTSYTLDRLFDMGVVPIINENDTTTIDELKFGDNDLLSAIVATKLDAELLLLMTVVDGLYVGDPTKDKHCQLLPRVERITPEIKALASSVKSVLGSGGMQSKLQAVEYASLAGIYSIIANGKKRNILETIISGKVDGTLFLPASRKRMSKRERWIAFGTAGRGRKIIIDSGATKALIQKGKSLLSVGIKDIEGEFSRGNVVFVCNEKGDILGKGLVNYSSDEVLKIKGVRTCDIAGILGYRDYEEVIHRDNFVLLIDT